jgi:hypothetical protein
LVQQGEVFGFLGPNGAGKTTTIRMLMGILVPTAGHAKIAALDCQLDRIEVKRRVGYLPDAPIFYDFLRGREILEFVGQMHGQSRSAAVGNAARLLDELALAEAAEEYAINYSTGMKKEVGAGLRLIRDPSVLIPGRADQRARSASVTRKGSPAPAAVRRVRHHLLLDASARHRRAPVLAGWHHPQRRTGGGRRLDKLRASIVPGGSSAGKCS